MVVIEPGAMASRWKRSRCMPRAWASAALIGSAWRSRAPAPAARRRSRSRASASRCGQPPPPPACGRRRRDGGRACGPAAGGRWSASDRDGRAGWSSVGVGMLAPSSAENDPGIVEIAGERNTGQPLEGLDVARAGAGDDLLRKLGPRVRLLPAGLLAEVAHELLVERGLRPGRRVAVGRPEARGVRRYRLVAEVEAAALVQARSELR